MDLNLSLKISLQVGGREQRLALDWGQGKLLPRQLEATWGPIHIGQATEGNLIKTGGLKTP